MNEQTRVTNAVEDLGETGWVKPWSGASGQDCVEALRLDDGRIALRQSKDPDGPAVIYETHEMVAFVQGVKAGLFDSLLRDA